MHCIVETYLNERIKTRLYFMNSIARSRRSHYNSTLLSQYIESNDRMKV